MARFKSFLKAQEPPIPISSGKDSNQIRKRRLCLRCQDESSPVQIQQKRNSFFEQTGPVLIDERYGGHSLWCV